MWQQLLAESLPWNGRRVRLRLITLDDASLHARLSNDLEIRRFLGPTLDLTEEKAAEGLRRMSAAGNALYVIESISNGASLGYCGFMPNRDIPETDMLISLLPEHQHRGYGGDVLSMLKSAWMDRLGNGECFATVWPENVGAISLLEAHGFVRVREYSDIFEQVHYVYRVGRAPVAT